VKKTILIAGGGTGGHISPGVALFEALRENGARPFFLAGKRDRRFSYWNNMDEDEVFFYRAPTLTRNIIKLPLFALSFAAAVLRARSIIKFNEVDAVIGMGGYVSAPALVAARSLGLPIFLCEQNSVPGMVTRLFEKKAVRIFGSFKTSLNHIKSSEKFVHAGNPIMKKAFASVEKSDARKQFHLQHTGKVILALGGSQGAVRINELIYGLKKDYSDELSNIGIIWSTGSLSFESYKKKVQKEIDGGSTYMSPFIEKMGDAYRACDLAICRAGAGVMMELAAMGVPSILIPYPYAAMWHQDKNADEFVEAGAAIKIINDEATPKNVIPVLRELLSNETTLARMSRRAKECARPEAAKTIALAVISEISTESGNNGESGV
jgi:UDP-N-acetylglucosamine--N-acetylmuramyl-(pentapeptide) pyrophosphoryl-undecaprenol N-acetylglucosamine transferase